MRICPTCNVRWPSSLDFCLRDGTALPAEETDAADWKEPELPEDGERSALTPYRKGDELRGHILEEPLGEGDIGVVWRARHTHLKRKVAIKALHPDLCTDAEVLRRFFREAQVVNALKHPNIVSILDFVDEPGRPPFIVMEYLEGDNLSTLLSPDALLRLDACFSIARQTADAMALVHERGIVHRDLNPANVFVERGEGGVHVKLVDFGLAKFHLDNNAMLRTQTGAIVGTPMFMAPEQIRGQTVDHRSDIYSMGCILYALLTGEPPFVSDKIGILLRSHLYDPPAPPTLAVGSARRLAIPPELERATLRCLAKDPELRVQSMRELVEVIDTMEPRLPATSSVEEDLPGPGHDRPPATQPATDAVAEVMERRDGRQTQKIRTLAPPRRRPRWWNVAIALALVLVGALVAVWVIRLTSPQPAAHSSPPKPQKEVSQADVDPLPRAWPKPAADSRRVQVLSVPAGASLINPRTGQKLWTTPALVTLPRRRPRELMVELKGYHRRVVSLSPETRGPVRVTLRKHTPRSRRRRARKPPMRDRPPRRRLPFNDTSTVDPFRK